MNRSVEDIRDTIGEYFLGIIEKIGDDTDTPMTPPVPGSINIVPLACLWAPLHPDGKPEPFFYASTKGGSAFGRVAVFSMSSFLRNSLAQSGSTAITLELPSAHERINRLQQLFVPA